MTKFGKAYKLYCGDVIYWSLPDPSFRVDTEHIVTLPHGYGLMFRANAKPKYKGVWSNGQAHGWGIYYPVAATNPGPVSGAWRYGRNPRCPGVLVNYRDN